MELRQRLLLIAIVAGALLPAPLRAELPALRALVAKGARVSATIVDLQSGATVEQLNARERVAPASLTKLLTTAAALDAWPVDKTFDTALYGPPPVEGIIRADLVLRGAGDATFDDEKLWLLAARLRDLGVREVAGDLVVSPGGFGTLACDTRDRCEGIERSTRAYNALLTSIGVDFGNWCIVVRPAEAGTPATLRSCTGTALPMVVEGRIETAASGTRSNFDVERVTTRGEDRLKVRGHIAPGDEEHVYRAMSDPSQAIGLLLREALAQLGVTVRGNVVVAAATLSAPAGLQRLAMIESMPLREQLGRMMRYSNNYIADVLTLNLAAEKTRQPQTRLSTASLDLMPLVREPGQAALPADAPVLMSGSGLTPENRVSARELTTLLAREYRDARRFPAFLGTLVVPREAPFGFLRRGGPAWLDRVALKTGSMNEPISVGGVAGYLRKSDGGWMAFAVIVNGSATWAHVPLDQAIGAARSDIEAVLARH